MNHPLEEPHRAEEEGALRRFLQSGAPRRCVQPSRSAGQGRFPAQGCAVFSGKGLTWRPGVGPGCRQEEHEAEAAAEPERRHGQAGPRRPPLQGAARRLAAGSFSLCVRCAFLFLDQVVLSTLLPDSVLTGREPVFQGVTHLWIRRTQPSGGRQTHRTLGAVKALTPAAGPRLAARRAHTWPRPRAWCRGCGHGSGGRNVPGPPEPSFSPRVVQSSTG